MTELRTIRVGMEWAHIVTDEATGLFVAHGSYGTFAYTWHPNHRGVSLHEFLARLHRDYFMGKTKGRDAVMFDCERTRKDLKLSIIDCRRNRSCTTQEARKAWNALEDIEDTDSGDLFMEHVYQDGDIAEVVCDLGEMRRECASPQCVEFWRVIWPAFLAEIAEKVPA